MDHAYGVGWGTLMLINAGLAQGKGRGGFAWFLLSIVLGPVATLFIVMLPPVNPARDSYGLALPPPREGTREDIAPQE